MLFFFFFFCLIVYVVVLVVSYSFCFVSILRSVVKNHENREQSGYPLARKRSLTQMKSSVVDDDDDVMVLVAKMCDARRRKEGVSDPDCFLSQRILFPREFPIFLSLSYSLSHPFFFFTTHSHIKIVLSQGLVCLQTIRSKIFTVPPPFS